MPEFLEEIFLAERISPVEQAEQQVLRFVGCFAVTIVLLIDSGQGTGRNEQLGKQSRGGW